MLYSLFTKPATRATPLCEKYPGITSEWVAGLVNEVIAIIFVKKTVFEL